MDSWIMVPCQRSRLPLLQRLLSSLHHPKDHVVIVATEPDPLTITDLDGYANHIALFPSSAISIAKWWNTGLDFVQSSAAEQHEVLVLSSDYTGWPNSVELLAGFMRNHNLAMVGPEHRENRPRFFRLDDPRDAVSRVPGACWMLAGETGLRADPEFRWWYADDDLEMQARRYSGAGTIPNTGLISGPDTPLDSSRWRWADEDRAKFVSKWGKQPW